MTELLHVRGLSVDLPTARGWVRPVNDLSFAIAGGASLGLVGESGSGKTMLALALMGLLPPQSRVSGEALLSASSAPQNLATLTDQKFRRLRGLDVAMIFQEPMTSLNPVMRIGAQIAEAIAAHFSHLSVAQLHNGVFESLRLAVVPEPAVRSRQFQHQLSGGLRQRVMIAMAIAAGISDPQGALIAGAQIPATQNGSNHPRLLIADEPTTALDVTVQKQILELLDDLRRRLGLGLLFITHDLGVVARVADRIAVMYAGRIVEQGPVSDVLRNPRHPYTQGLIAASPTLERGKLLPILGTVPQLTALPPGCTFEPRCPLRLPECRLAVPELRAAGSDHAARCILVGREVAADLRI